MIKMNRKSGRGIKRIFMMLGASVFVVVLVVALLIVKHERDLASKSEMAELRKMNRGKIDQPGWIKQPWQHEPGEGKQ
jgi:hypothetical protein